MGMKGFRHSLVPLVKFQRHLHWKVWFATESISSNSLLYLEKGERSSGLWCRLNKQTGSLGNKSLGSHVNSLCCALFEYECRQTSKPKRREKRVSVLCIIKSTKKPVAWVWKITKSLYIWLINTEQFGGIDSYKYPVAGPSVFLFVLFIFILVRSCLLPRRNHNLETDNSFDEGELAWDRIAPRHQ